jgi:hypothetical protein
MAGFESQTGRSVGLAEGLGLVSLSRHSNTNTDGAGPSSNSGRLPSFLPSPDVAAMSRLAGEEDASYADATKLPGGAPSSSPVLGPGAATGASRGAAAAAGGRVGPLGLSRHNSGPSSGIEVGGVAINPLSVFQDAIAEASKEGSEASSTSASRILSMVHSRELPGDGSGSAVHPLLVASGGQQGSGNLQQQLAAASAVLSAGGGVLRTTSGSSAILSAVAQEAAAAVSAGGQGPPAAGTLTSPSKSQQQHGSGSTVQGSGAAAQGSSPVLVGSFDVGEDNEEDVETLLKRIGSRPSNPPRISSFGSYPSSSDSHVVSAGNTVMPSRQGREGSRIPGESIAALGVSPTGGAAPATAPQLQSSVPQSQANLSLPPLAPSSATAASGAHSRHHHPRAHHSPRSATADTVPPLSPPGNTAPIHRRVSAGSSPTGLGGAGGGSSSTGGGLLGSTPQAVHGATSGLHSSTRPGLTGSDRQERAAQSSLNSDLLIAGLGHSPADGAQQGGLWRSATGGNNTQRHRHPSHQGALMSELALGGGGGGGHHHVMMMPGYGPPGSIAPTSGLTLAVSFDTR